MSNWVIVAYDHFLGISWLEQVTKRWDYNEVRFVQDHHA